MGCPGFPRRVIPGGVFGLKLQEMANIDHVNI